MAIENYNTFTEVDTEGKFTVSAASVEFADLEYNDFNYVYKDYGGGYFDGNEDFIHSLQVRISDGSNYGFVEIWRLGNDLGAYKPTWQAYKDFLSLMIYCNNWDSGFLIFSLEQWNNGAANTDSSVPIYCDGSNVYYVEIELDADFGTYGKLYARIYDSVAKENLLDTLAITLTERKNFRYLYAVGGRGDSDVWDCYGSVRNLNIGLGGHVGLSPALDIMIL